MLGVRGGKGELLLRPFSLSQTLNNCLEEVDLAISLLPSILPYWIPPQSTAFANPLRPQCVSAITMNHGLFLRFDQLCFDRNILFFFFFKADTFLDISRRAGSKSFWLVVNEWKVNRKELGNALTNRQQKLQSIQTFSTLTVFVRYKYFYKLKRQIDKHKLNMEDSNWRREVTKCMKKETPRIPIVLK